MSDNQEQRLTLNSEGWVTPSGQFQIMAISAGPAHGWEFSEDVLRSSLSLWDGTNCFVDHAYWEGHSVRDLAGVFSEPYYDEDLHGILMKLTTTGPSGPLLDQLGREWLKEDQPKPNIGFSADVFFTSKGRQVVQITRVQSLDLVINPARGGAFVRALN